jgi:hypothetical protein
MTRRWQWLLRALAPLVVLLAVCAYAYWPVLRDVVRGGRGRPPDVGGAVDEFSEDGVIFTYPRSWSLEREGGDGWTVTVQSPGAAFAMLRLDRAMPDARQVADAALEALRADYPALKATPVSDRLAGEAASGHDISFVTSGERVTCRTRALPTPAGTLLVLCQFAEYEQGECEPALRAICASLRVNGGRR